MRRVLASVMAIITCVCGGGTAHAGSLTTYSPTGGKILWSTVSVIFGSGSSISCPMTINATATANSMAVTSISMGGLCSIASFSLLPYQVTAPMPIIGVGMPPGPVSQLQISNIDMVGPFGVHCAGNLTGR